MPAQAGIQVHAARALGEAAWIPGLAVRARNDGTANSLRISCARYLGFTKGNLIGQRQGNGISCR